jgi:DNA-binding protein YbaB
MTDEVGVITGDLTLATVLRPDGLATVHIQYTGAEEWYTLTGCPALVEPDSLETLHAAVLHAVRQGGEAVVPGPGRR